MAFDFGAGLAEMGKSIAQTAQVSFLESQRGDLEKEKVMLADQLAGARQDKQNLHTAGESAKDRDIKISEGAKDRESADRRNSATVGASLSVAQMNRQTQIELQRMKQSEDPAEVKLAKSLENFTPEQWDALRKFQEIQKPKTAPEHTFGWERDPDTGELRPAKGGPRDPAYIGDVEASKNKPKTEYREVNGKLVAVEKGTGQAAIVPIPGAEKPLDNSARDDLGKVATPVRQLSALVKAFDPKFAGYKAESLGGLVNTYGRNVADADSGAGKQAAWWQEYQSFANLERNRLFGSALTPGEKTEFEKAMVNPGMTPEQINRNLTRQREIALNVLSRSAHAMREDGYNPRSIEALIGIPFKKLPDPNNFDPEIAPRTEETKPASADPTRTNEPKSDARQFQPGTFKGPDSKPVSWKDIEATAKNRGISTDDVIMTLGLKPLSLSVPFLGSR